MLSSLLPNNKESSDSFQIAHRTYVTSQLSYENYDFNQLIDILFDTQYTKNHQKRIELYIFLSDVLLSKKSIDVTKRINQLIDRFSSLLESIQTDIEGKAYNQLLETILHINLDESNQLLTRVIPKLVSCACRITKQSHLTITALETIEILLNSELRHILTSNLNVIREIAMLHLESNETTDISISIISLTFSFENNENWIKYWKLYIFECINLMNNLGFAIPINHSLNQSINNSIKIENNSNNNNLNNLLLKYNEKTLSGNEKTFYFEKLFKIYFNILQKVSFYYIFIKI